MFAKLASIAIVATLVTTRAFAGGPTRPVADYFDRLTQLQDRYIAVSKLYAQGKDAQAEERRSLPHPAGLDDVWRLREGEMLFGPPPHSAVDLSSESPPEENDGNAFTWGLERSKYLAEGGDYREARDVLEISARAVAGDESLVELVGQRMVLLDELIAGKIPNLEFYHEYFVTTDWSDFPRNFPNLSAIVAVWELDVRPDEYSQKRLLLLELLGEPDMLWDRTARKLLLEEMAADTSSPDEDRAGAILMLGSDARQSKDLDEAIAQYERVIDGYTNTQKWAEAVYNKGTALEQRSGFEAAIETFELLPPPQTASNDPASDGYRSQTYRYHFSRAQWEMGQCYIALDKYDLALKAFITSDEESPRQLGFLDCMGTVRYRNDLYQALCHEHLGNYPQAVALYWRATMDNGSLFDRGHDAESRLVDLYRAAGQLGELQKELRAAGIVSDKHVMRIVNADPANAADGKAAGKNERLEPGPEFPPLPEKLELSSPLPGLPERFKPDK